MELFFFFRFLWKYGLSYEAQAGSVCSGNVDFSRAAHFRKGKKEQKIWLQQQRLGESEALAENNKSEEQNN